MATYACAGRDCERHISVSLLPGGNEVALAEPDRWAFLHVKCSRCHWCLCDRCIVRGETVASGIRCRECGGSVEVPEREKNVRITRGLAEAAWKDKRYGDVVGFLEILPFLGVALTAAEAKKVEYCSRQSTRDAAVPTNSSARSDGRRPWWKFW